MKIIHFEKVTNFELHNFGLITEHNLSKCREGGRGWSYLFHKIVEKLAEEKEIHYSRVRERPVIQKKNYL